MSILKESDMKFWQSLAMGDVVELRILAQAAERLGFEGVMLGYHLAFEQKAELEEQDIAGSVDAYWQNLWERIDLLVHSTRALRFIIDVDPLPVYLSLRRGRPIGRAGVLSDSRVAVCLRVGSGRDDVAGLHDRETRIDATQSSRRDPFSSTSLAPDSLEPVGALSGFGTTLPIYFSGISPSALQRAAMSQGWVGGTYEVDQLEEIVNSLRLYKRHIGELLDGRFEVFANISDIDVGKCAQAEAVGVTHHYRRPWVSAMGCPLGLSVQEKIKDMEVFSWRFIGNKVHQGGSK